MSSAATPARKVAPNPLRPRLPDLFEVLVAPVDQRSAEAYDAAEAACEKLAALEAGAERGAVVGEELDITESLAHEINDAGPKGRV